MAEDFLYFLGEDWVVTLGWWPLVGEAKKVEKDVDNYKRAYDDSDDQQMEEAKD